MLSLLTKTKVHYMRKRNQTNENEICASVYNVTSAQLYPFVIYSCYRGSDQGPGVDIGKINTEMISHSGTHSGDLITNPTHYSRDQILREFISDTCLPPLISKSQIETQFRSHESFTPIAFSLLKEEQR